MIRRCRRWRFASASSKASICVWRNQIARFLYFTISFGLLLGILYQLVDGAARDRGAVASSLGSVEGPYGLRVLAYETQHEINACKGSATRRSRCRAEIGRASCRERV